MVDKKTYDPKVLKGLSDRMEFEDFLESLMKLEHARDIPDAIRAQAEKLGAPPISRDIKSAYRILYTYAKSYAILCPNNSVGEFFEEIEIEYEAWKMIGDSMSAIETNAPDCSTGDQNDSE